MEERIEIGDVIKMKKQHPCGTNEWEVLRTGMDFRLKCLGCDHQVMVPRKLVEKNFRGFIRRTDAVSEAQEAMPVHKNVRKKPENKGKIV